MDVCPVELEVEVPVTAPYDAPGIFRFLAVRAVAGVEATDLSHPERLRYARTLTLPGGPAAALVFATRTRKRSWALRARLHLAAAADQGPALAVLRVLFDVDTDPAEADGVLAADPVLAPLVKNTPGIRIPGTVDPHELVVRALVGQQISVAAARTHLGRLAGTLGTPYAPPGLPTMHLSGERPDEDSLLAQLHRHFPTAAQIASGVPEPVSGERPDPERPLRLPGQAVGAVVGTCRALAGGELAVHAGVEPEVLRRDLLARPRIGPWTAAYVAMRVLGDPDAWLDGDVALVAGAKAAGLLDPDLATRVAHRALAARAADWSPWRSYAAMHLWQLAGRRATMGRDARPRRSAP
ncbi:DNA-3-methyladenine glycosylase [Citricoccus nitrophenolicus]|uniref:DNA-3-methyladenine glycosylase II n=1 Tax=Citricoccus muralis TaxID=169134 RepID=A0A3D9LE46_9MICC|nr:AlkA N-terminal domain-containing protein [Citricoccus muralis]REE04422.1 DNA-3-methyladenine glycosylase II [Citricoccus muralis]